MNGNIVATPQDHKSATFTKKFLKKDGELKLSDDGYQNYLKFCALEDSVGTHFLTLRGGKEIRVKIKDARYENGAFIPTLVVPEGGREMPYEDFLRGLK